MTAEPLSSGAFPRSGSDGRTWRCRRPAAQPAPTGGQARPRRPAPGLSGTAKTRFLKRLAAAGLSLDSLTPAAGVAAMLTYYADERAEGCPFEDDGDMLLFEWGTHDWGEGPAFEVAITRQLIVPDDENEEPRQLGLTFRFDPPIGDGVREGNRWCRSPDELAKFRRFVTRSAALKAVAQQSAVSVGLRYGRT